MFTSQKLKGLKHGFFSRCGGVSQGFFASLNFGLNKGDDIGNVIQNRNIALEKLGIPQLPLLTLKQIHSAEVKVVTEPWPFNVGAAPHVDGVVTNKPGIALGILTADCAPVLFADVQARVIGAAHAGWRGAQAGVIANTVEAMCSLGAECRRIVAAVGPCIAQESYEVDAEFYERFITQHPASQTYFMAAPQTAHFLFDLPGFVKFCLMQAGIETIEGLNLNTYANPDLFFSCRRAFHKNEPTFGNNISIIAM